ncbi:helix-turn-helix domain-containing protein [Tsukamurella tyrosinosolvens]|uniref:helix-turn-helix domain-containing protein n=1 Tax=Tsukamurella tyrosinosolvens TaxID=57704 RepID=UPI000D1C8C3A
MDRVSDAHRLPQGSDRTRIPPVRQSPSAPLARRRDYSRRCLAKQQRLTEARRLLEAAEYTIEQIATVSDFASAIALRQNFTAVFPASPGRYRRQFPTLTLGVG